jgi:hypothetical protein
MAAPLSDLEIQMEIFRLLRTGRFLQAKTVLDEVKRLLPHEPEERLRRCMGQLADRLLKNT